MKNIFAIFAVLLVALCPLTGHSQATTGYHRFDVVLTKAKSNVQAQVVPFATVTVTSTATGLAAVIYSDPALLTRITPSVVHADGNGNYGYYFALNYCVTETISAPGNPPVVIKNVCSNGGGGGGYAPASPSGSLQYNNGGIFGSVTLTTTGSSGPSTFSGGILNIPQYSGGGASYPGVTSDGANGLAVTGAVKANSLFSLINPVYDVAGYADVQAAINAANLAGGGTVLLHANSTYSGALTLKENVTIQCVDRTALITIPNATNAAVITVAGSNTAIKHCTIDGNASHQSSNGDAIKNSIDYVNLTIEDNEIRNVQRYGFRSDSTFDVDHVSLINNYIHDTGEQIIYILGADTLLIRGNSFANWTLNGADDAPAITLADGDPASFTYHITSLVISGNAFQNSIGTRFAIESAAPAYSTVVNGCSISGNTFEGNGLDASGISGWFFNCSMTGNSHNNGGGSHRSGYEFAGNNNTISGNAIINGSIAITSTTQSSKNNVVSNNTITNSVPNGTGDASGILIGGGDVATTDTVITGNHIYLTDVNPQSGIYLGVYGTSQTINRITVQNNEIRCNGGGNAIRLFAGVGSSDIGVSGNVGSNCTNGYIDTNDANHTTEINITDNDFSGNTTAITVADTTTIRQWGNITSTTQSSQQFAGGAGSTSAGAGFFPAGLSNGDLSSPPTAGLTGWYAASSVCSVDGTSLTSWAPVNGEYGSTLAGGTTKAICKTNIVNGQPVVRFSGSANGYAGLLATGTNPSTMFVVYKKTVGSPSSGSGFLIDNSQFPTYGALYFTNPTTLQAFAGSVINATISDDGVFHTGLLSITTGNVGAIYLDGTQIVTGPVGASPFFPGITIGARQDQSNLFTGDIAEVLAYNGVLTTTQMKSVGAYLSNKYGIRYSGAWGVDTAGTASFAGLKISGGTTATTNHGDGVSLQHSDGTGTSALAGFDANGNTTPVTLTATGTSGPATFSDGTLNIPEYAGSGVTNINGTPGSFTFNFSAGAGSCTTTTCTFTGSGTGGGSVTDFIANSSSWPTWLVPSTATSTTTPTLSVAASAIPNVALANSSVTLGSTSVSLGATSSSVSGLGVDGATSTEVGYLSGVTSPLQTQLNGKQESLTITTTGSSGPSTLTGTILNIPQYSGGGGGGIVNYGSIQAESGWTGVHDTGTPGTSSGVTSVVSSPSMSGSARKFDTTFTSGGGERYSISFGTDTASTDFFYDGYVYIASGGSPIGNLELDMNQVIANGDTIIYGVQCDGGSGTWDYTKNSGTAISYVDTWVHSSQSCNPNSWATNAWHHVQMNYSRDGSGNITYGSIWLDSVESPINTTVFSEFALGWSSVLLTNFQMDGSGSGSNILYLDNLTISAGTGGMNNPMTTAGDIIYGTSAGVPARLGGNTAATDKVYVSHGTGSVAAAPTLANAPALSAANMTSFPTLNQNTTGTAAGLSSNITESQVTNLTTDLAAKAPLASPTFTGTVSGITATMVGLGSVTNDVQTKNSIVPNSFSGVRFGNGGSIDTAATGIQLSAAIGTTAVTNATNATNLSGGSVAATTLSASSTVSGTGFSNYLASPPSIGGVSPNTGKFTSLTDTGLSVAGIVTNSAGGVLSTETTVTSGQLPDATSGAKGAVQCGTGTACASGVMTVPARIASINGDSNAAQTIVSANGSMTVGTSSGTTTLTYTGPGSGAGTDPTILMPPTTFSALVAIHACVSGNKGMLADISDATVNTWGASITTGGGSNDVLARCNGTNWTVVGI